jgi:glycosyltransferase involved in cell wall biosynthesis
MRRPPEPLQEDVVRDLAAFLAGASSERSQALIARIRTLLGALDIPVPNLDHRPLLMALEHALRAGGQSEAWLALAVLTGRLPDSAQVRSLARAIRLDGPLTALFAALQGSGQLIVGEWPDVEVVTDRVLVDVHDTVRNPVPTGIQRVARQVARRWARDHDVVLIGWTAGFTAYRRLSVEESHTILNGRSQVSPGGSPPHPGVLVPWRCTHLVPELPAELEQAPRYQAFAAFSGSTTGLIGFDCVPVMAAETTAEGMSICFSRYLAAAAQVNRIATISQAAAVEYRGWRTMLAGAGRSGPDICCVPLPLEATRPTDVALDEVGTRLRIGSIPVVLSVGSHEPRKNHLAVLHAAEILWREGLLFSLVFVGGHTWNSAEFEAQVDILRRSNRPVQTILGLPDDLLWAAYRLAYCTVFVSLHEGFGLPVAESLASGTPVITSQFGSMLDLAGHGGALLADPRCDHSIADALRRLLTDQPFRDRLARQAATIALRTWDQYAQETWEYLAAESNPDRDRQ